MSTRAERDAVWIELANRLDERAPGYIGPIFALLKAERAEADSAIRNCAVCDEVILGRLTAAETELDALRFSLATLCSSLPRCQHCPNAATYAWHGGEELACDDHVPPAVASSTGFSLPYAARLRALSGGKKS